MSAETTMTHETGQQAATLAVLTNIPTPYRTNFFNRLALALENRQIRLVVIYCAHTEWNRQWGFSPEANRYENYFLKGLPLKLGKTTFHINPAIGSLLRKLRPAWILSAGAWLMPTGLFALMGTRAHGAKMLFWSEGHADAVRHAGGPVARLRRFVLRRYDAFAVPNAKSAEFLRTELNCEVTCLALPNTVDDRFFTMPTAAARADARHKLGLDAAHCLVLQVSQLEDRKGVIELCEGVLRYRSSQPSLRLAIVGTGTLAADLATRFAAEIKAGWLLLPGGMPPAEVKQWLHAADLFALNSKRDPNPLSSIEAALCGLPLLLSRYVGNATELVVPGRTGWMLPEVSPAAVEAQLAAALADPAGRLREMGLAAEQLARARFSTDAVIAAFIDQLLNLSMSPTRGSK